MAKHPLFNEIRNFSNYDFGDFPVLENKAFYSGETFYDFVKKSLSDDLRKKENKVCFVDFSRPKIIRVSPLLDIFRFNVFARYRMPEQKFWQRLDINFPYYALAVLSNIYYVSEDVLFYLGMQRFLEIELKIIQKEFFDRYFAGKIENHATLMLHNDCPRVVFFLESEEDLIRMFLKDPFKRTRFENYIMELREYFQNATNEDLMRRYALVSLKK